jgi:hypothetical protein
MLGFDPKTGVVDLKWTWLPERIDANDAKVLLVQYKIFGATSISAFSSSK